MRSRLRSDEQGSAALEVSLVLGAVVLLFLGILQIALTGLAATFLGGAASDAARGAAVASDLGVAEARLDESLGVPFLRIEERSIREAWDANIPVIEVRISASVPALLPWLPRLVNVTRHALIES